MKVPITITPYDSIFDSSIKALESSITQGKRIQLKIVKDYFLQRAAPFSNINPLLAINEKDQVVGTSIGAQTTLMVNGELFSTGFAFDTKVQSDYRNQGIGRQLAQAQKQWFNQQKWERNITTLKASNLPVVKLSKKGIGKIWLTSFVYITIPTNIRLEKEFIPSGKQTFNVRFFDQDNFTAEYVTRFTGGLAVFHTWKLYRLKIQSVPWLLKHAVRIVKSYGSDRFQLLPVEQDVMEFVTLFNHSNNNIHLLNSVLKHLQNEGRKYLTVCCRENDSVYRYLKAKSINTYKYYLLSDFPIGQQDEITIDVRCL